MIRLLFPVDEITAHDPQQRGLHLCLISTADWNTATTKVQGVLRDTARRHEAFVLKDLLYGHFCRVRLSGQWPAVLAKMQAWLGRGAKAEAA